MLTRILSVLALSASVSGRADTYRQEVGIGAFTLLNLKITAGVVGVPDPSQAARTDRDYVDGFNRVDSSGNLGEGAPGLASRTGNFGFSTNSQVDLARGTLALHALNPEGSTYFRQSSLRSDLAPEISYRVVRQRSGAATLGFEARLARLDFDSSSTETLAGTVRVLTDSYALGGVVPQLAPYAGTFAVQPGTQRIGDTPTRTLTSAGAVIQGNRKFSAEGWLLRFGLVWAPWQTQRLDWQVHAGPAVLNVKGSMQLNERWMTPGLPGLARTAQGTRRAWLAGAYLGTAVKVHLNQRWSLSGGIDVLSVDKLSLSGGGGRARIDFSSGLLVSAGVTCRF